MTKRLVIPSSKEQINNLKDYVDGYIIGLKDMSVNLPTYFSLFEIKEISETLEDKELFISINKNIHNNELDYLKEVLKEFESYNIKGVIYYDVSLINIKRELNLNINLVFSEEHAVTNYATINYWNYNGAEYAYLSNEITLDEVLEIKENSNSKLMVQVFGFLPIFVSERKIINNYLTYFDIDSNSDKYYIEKENKKYRILEDKNTTQVYTNYILNAIDEIEKLKEANVEYIVYNSFDIDEETFEYIIKKDDNLTSEDLDKLLDNTDKGFLYKETIYRVKNYEK